jgi:hypothetical protein
VLITGVLYLEMDTYPYNCGDVVHPQGVGSGGVGVVVRVPWMEIVPQGALYGYPQREQN